MKNSSLDEIYKYDSLYGANPDYGITQDNEPRFATTLRYLASVGGIKTVLDAGVGRGGFYYRSRQIYDTYGIEPSKVAIGRFHAGDDRIKNLFIQEAREHYPENFFDAVICLDVLEHIPEQDIDACFESMKKIGKRYFIFSIAHHEDIIDGLDLHITDLDYWQWEEKLRRHFDIAEVTSIHDDRARIYLLEKKEQPTQATGEYPSYLTIRLTSRCNLECFICDRDSVERADFDFELLGRLAEPIRRASIVDLTGVGEPFLYPKFKQALDYICSLNRNASLINLTSNGTVLSREIAGMLNGRLNGLVISLNAATEATYERDMKHGNFKRTLERIGGFVSALNPAERVKLDLHFVAHAGNYQEIPDFVSLADQLGIKNVSVWPFLVTYPDQIPNTLLNVKKEYNSVIGYARILAKKLEVKLSARLFGEEKPSSYLNCPQPFTVCNIQEDGNVAPCCNAGKITFGNIRESDFESIWFGKKFQDFRENRHQVACQRCSTYYPLDTLNAYLQAHFYERYEE